MNGPTTDKLQRFPIGDIESYWTITNRRLHELDLNSVLKGYKTTTCTLTSLASKLRARSIDQFCRCFGVGRTTAYEQIKLGRLRARKVGKRTIITDDDAEEWLRNLPQVETKR